MNWNLRHCARRGHATYLPNEPELAGRLTATTAAGIATRCLRCGDFIIGEPAGNGPAANAPHIPRGKALRDQLLMRLLSIERGIRGLLLVAAAVAVWRFRGAEHSLNLLLTQEMPALRQLWATAGLNIDSSYFMRQAHTLITVSQSTLTLVTTGLLLYAGVQFAESVGLWLEKAWGEYLAVVASSLFIPLEIFELADKPTAVKAVVLAVNIVVVIWLIVSKRLFGVRGGQAAHHAALQTESILNMEKLAASTADQSQLQP
ncbi:MAG: DUF2127 domain-containing protein [Microbacteriaceae bacterium]|nr:DUF2127 domain-containing protein [Microbacteriaceae bacterium]